MPVAEPTARVTIRAPADLVELFAATAAAGGRTFSEELREAMRDRLARPRNDDAEVVEASARPTTPVGPARHEPS